MIQIPLLQDKSIVVMGLGKSGTATARALMSSGAHVLAWDDSAPARDAATRDGVPIGNPLESGLANVDLVVWSPGIPHTLPKPHAVAEAARAANIPVVCDVDLLARAKPANRILAITGTNGKSTTTTLLAHILTEAGRSVAAGGNLGTAALALPDLGADGRYVLELSSYQLELCPSLQAHAGVLLNITPDHLGRHGGMDGYVAAKRGLFAHIAPGGTAVIGVDDPYSAAIADDLETTGQRVMRISAQRRLTRGISAPDGVLLENGEPVLDLHQALRLPGRHNWQNAAAAFALARADGIPSAAAAAALLTYPGLAHRQELVATLDGVAFINDSKATNADAVATALVCYEDIYWILGGQAKEGGIASLTSFFPRIKHAYLIGEAAAQFAETLGDAVPHTQCGTLDVAVTKAAKAARAADQPGVVLLSPACASWDQFTSFEHRGDVFRTLVQSLSQGGAS